MLQSPMLEIKRADSALEVNSTSLRRAATALFFFGMLCARPCPSSWGAWLAMIGAGVVLCSSQSKILCRARCARFLSIFAAIFAGHKVVSLVLSFRAGMPLQISDTVHTECVGMPAATFAYVQHKLVDHMSLNHGLAFLLRRMDMAEDTTSTPALLVTPQMNASSLAPVLVGSVDPGAWTQPEACNKLSHMVTCFVKMLMIGSTLAHLLLLLSAVVVVKRVCRLRCAAYRAGVLKWQCGAGCKSKCPSAAPVDVVAPPPAAKEMA